MTFAPPAANLDPSIDWAKLGLAVTDIVNGHVECRYDAEAGKWLAPTFVRDPYLRIHGLAPGLNYGQQVYEGLKASRNRDEEILLFRADRHARRMAHSAYYVSIPPIPEELFLDSVRLAVAENAEFVPPYATNAALYIRPLAFGSAGHFALTPPREYLFCVFVQPFVTYHGSGAADALIIDEFDRAAPRGTGSAKVGGNYAPVMRYTDKARAEGFPLTLHLDSKTQTEIDEFSTSSFIGVKSGNDTVSPTLVVPDSKNAIESVTSDSTVAVAKAWGWTVEKRPVLYNQLADFTEVIAAGTAAALVPIRSITRRSTGDKFTFESGPLCQKLSTYLRQIQRGESSDFPEWVEVLQPPEVVYNKYKTAELPTYGNGHENGLAEN
ncbi:subgroup IIIi aminotransferase, putative [Talaromyces stipitatus ATCC 10500]|uniref:Subgroup IIIi aminotransferase, putative n=1 Tax=Talaromyces stipitatus (strain ATCC 10500 / CBS 375.48 / QM 6759 / NRRL 1006) TaxID=441959 RepID=B8LZT6_TALSN|nr:subgroup IIIi aminotransferase, putative [Talaromyces stipitatus ATCC 10500]EED20868.1 subgroup IIIi aminotransferase, putative [Talaromyces stipitatus ATCC 10500]